MDLFLKFFWWLRPLMYIWVRSKVFPKQVSDHLNLDSSQSVCYVLKTRSLRDLLVLDYYCVKFNLPRPVSRLNKLGNGSKKASVIFLSASGLIQAHRSKKAPTKLSDLIIQSKSAKTDIKIVPVSVFWGRNPGTEEKSIFKLLFFDDEYGGSFQRLITFFVHGRNVFCNFGKSISIKNMLQEDSDAEVTSKKIRRVLKVHFRGQRETVLGPQIYDRQRVINEIIESKDVQDILQSELKKGKSPEWKIERKARRYADEVCAKVSPSAIRFFDLLLCWLWKKIYQGLEVKGGENLRALAEKNELVYMPCHRSHMDYLLIGYVLYYLGLIPPHTIAGINLNFWPVGPLLRRGGGIFIRRRFRGNELYGAIVDGFVKYLIHAGFPMCFYPEGGRSRTGLLLPPKLGILSMVIRASQKKKKKPVLLVPIYVGYDSLMEAETYQKELQGKSKKNESFGQLFGARKMLKGSFGKAYIGFGEPLNLQEHLELHKSTSHEDDRPLEVQLKTTSQEMMTRINNITMVTPISLFSLTLLASPKNALSESDLIEISKLLVTMGQEQPYSPLVEYPKSDLATDLAGVEQFGNLQRLVQSEGDIIFVDEIQSRLLKYYSNNIIHLFAVHSLVATGVILRRKIGRNTLVEGVSLMLNVLKEQLFLPWSEGLTVELASNTIDLMLKHGLIVQEDNGPENSPDQVILVCPEVVSSSHAYLKVISGIIQPYIEKHALILTLLANSQTTTPLDLEVFRSNLVQLSHRLSILGGLEHKHLFEEASFMPFIDRLINTGSLIRVKQDQVELTDICRAQGSIASYFLSEDIRQYISKAKGKAIEQTQGEKIITSKSAPIESIK